MQTRLVQNRENCLCLLCAATPDCPSTHSQALHSLQNESCWLGLPSASTSTQTRVLAVSLFSTGQSCIILDGLSLSRFLTCSNTQSALQTPVSWAAPACWGHSIPFFSHDSTSGHPFPKAFPNNCLPATATPALLTEEPLLSIASSWAVWGQSPKGWLREVEQALKLRKEEERERVWWQPNMCGAHPPASASQELG